MIRAVLLAFLGGGVAAGVVVYFAAKRTQADLSGAGAGMQAAFEAAGNMTAQQLQAQANVWAHEIAAAGQAQITAAAYATADDVIAHKFGITTQFLADVAKVQAVAADPWPTVAAAARRFA